MTTATKTSNSGACPNCFRMTASRELLDSSVGLVTTNAPGSRNVIESISWRQSTRAIGRHVGPKPVADLPPNFAHDKGRYHSQLQTDSWQGLEPARSDDFPGRRLSEAVLQVCARVIGNDATVTWAAAQLSTFELNVGMPVIAHTILESVRLLATGATRS